MNTLAQWRRWLTPSALSPEDERAFAPHAASRTAALCRSMMLLFGAGLLLYWPIDDIVLPDDPIAREVWARLRLGLFAITGLFIALLQWSATVRRHPGVAFTVTLLACVALSAEAVATVGGLDSPWFYGGYAVPGLTLMLVVPLWARIGATLALTLAWTGTYLAIQQHDLVTHVVIGVVGFQLMMVLCSVAVGQGTYRILQRNWAQQRFIRQTFGRYFSGDVAEAVLEHHAGRAAMAEERVVTVLFSDLRGYSTVVEHAEPAQVLAVLNTYFHGMQAVIEGAQGTVLEYVGDGIMVVFGAPAELEGHADQAVRCAVEMQRRLVELNARWEADGVARLWKDQGVDHLVARCGIHTGRVVAGSFGGERFMKYGIIGDAVNVAARLEQLNKTLGTTVLLSGETYARLSPELAEGLLDRGDQTLRGRAGVVRAYSPA